MTELLTYAEHPQPPWCLTSSSSSCLLCKLPPATIRSSLPNKSVLLPTQGTSTSTPSLQAFSSHLSRCASFPCPFMFLQSILHFSLAFWFQNPTWSWAFWVSQPTWLVGFLLSDDDVAYPSYGEMHKIIHSILSELVPVLYMEDSISQALHV